MVDTCNLKKIVITGSSGFIGRHVLASLVREFEIYPMRLDLKDHAPVAAQLKKIEPDALLHFSWETTPGVFWHAPSNLDWLKASIALLESFVLSGGKRVVIAGSCAERASDTLYGACKERLRTTAAAFLNSQNVSFGWGRIFSPYGPYEHPKRLIPSLIKTLMDHAPFECTSQNHFRDFLYVEDVADAFVALLTSRVEGTVDIGSGDAVRIGDLVDMVATQFGAATTMRYGATTSTADNPSSLIANPTRLSQEVGFHPKYTLQEGLKKTVAWWQYDPHAH